MTHGLNPNIAMFEEGTVTRRLEAVVKPLRALQSTLTTLSWSPGHRRLGNLNVPMPDHDCKVFSVGVLLLHPD